MTYYTPNEIRQATYDPANTADRVELVGGGISIGSVDPIAASSDFWPSYNQSNLGGGQLKSDPAGALVTRGAVSTDEGAGRVNFTNSATYFTLPTITFTHGSTTVTGAGFTTSDIHFLDYIKLDADASSAWAQVSFIDSDTSLILTAPYSGTSTTGTADISSMGSVAGTGSTITVASGQMTMALGTTATAQTYVYKGDGSCSGYIWQTSLNISQRIANQDIYFGIETAVTGTNNQFARFHFTGTTNTQVITETGYNPTNNPSASEMETNTITLPNSVTTAVANTYSIEADFEQVVFRINNIEVATHTKRLPRIMALGQNQVGLGNSVFGFLRGLNGTTPASNTNLVVDYLFIKAYDRLDTNPNSIQNTAATQDATPASSTTLEVVGMVNPTGGVDRLRSNLDTITVLSSAARTTTQTQADQINYNHRGIMVVVNVTVIGTGSITPEIDAKDPVSATYFSLLTASTAITANGTYVYMVYPGATQTAGTNNNVTQDASFALPRTWRVKLTANNANTVTYSVGAMLIV